MARHLRLTSIIILVLLSLSMVFAQDSSIPVLKAKLGHTPDLSPQAEADWEKGRLIHEKVVRGELAYEKLTPEEKRLYDCYSEEYESIWATQSQACSWYCGGGPYLVTASSFLAPQSGNTYNPDNIHDFILKTAWVEGANGHGIGEYIELFFKPLSPRVNKIEIMNGYVKSETAWRIGDEVASYDFATKSIETAMVTGLVGARHDNLISLKIGEVEIVSTDDHPYYVAGKGWCSLDPEKTSIYRNMDRVGTLRVGDTLIRVDADGKMANVIVEEIERLAHAEDTYTITKLDRHDSFFANGILVGIEE